MASKISIDRRSGEGAFPNVCIRHISLYEGKVRVQVCVKQQVKAKSEINLPRDILAPLENVKIKTILSFNPELTKQISNKKISFRKNFNN